MEERNTYLPAPFCELPVLRRSKSLFLSLSEDVTQSSGFIQRSQSSEMNC